MGQRIMGQRMLHTFHDHSAAHVGPDRRGTTRMATAVVATLALMLALAAPVDAQPAPYDRGIDRACLGGTQSLGQFADVSPGTHAGAIDCLGAYFITFGQLVDGEPAFVPRGIVTRQQMGSFIARLLFQVRSSVYVLPVAHDTAFPDVSGVHRGNVGSLADAGIAQGFADGTFGGAQPVTREQTASFIVRTIETVTGQTLDRAPVFDDLTATHGANVEKLASIGVVQGRAPGTFDPRADIRRQEMATILARTMDHLVEQEAFFGLEVDLGTDGLWGLTDVAVDTTAAHDRVTFGFQGDGTPGYRVRYVDEALAQGTGDVIDVDGDAILQVVFTGAALPFDLPPDVEAELWDDETIDVSGSGAVQIVSDSIFEGQYVIYIGTTTTQPVAVGRGTDPTTVTIDVPTTGGS